MDESAEGVTVALAPNKPPSSLRAPLATPDSPALVNHETRWPATVNSCKANRAFRSSSFSRQEQILPKSDKKNKGPPTMGILSQRYGSVLGYDL
mmetsp:Transcript_2974/g.6094  ORF Transcript_2974/g.6094 Transcript_2974/m.6094 type:complete len:94 (-) Transcript_2974:43-324(-)